MTVSRPWINCALPFDLMLAYPRPVSVGFPMTRTGSHKRRAIHD